MNSKQFIPNGVEDIHSNEYQRKEYLITNIKELYKSFGYRQIQTPTFEYYDLFYGIEGTIDLDEMIKMIDENGKILVLRPDVTTPIARMVAAHYKSSSENLKFSYITNVFRMNDGKNGIKREFTQAGVEYLGNNKVEADGEVIALAIRSLLNCGIKEFKIDIGQICFFKGLLKELNISSSEGKNIRKLVERKNYPELETLIKGINTKQEIKEAMLAMPFLYGKPKDVLKAAKKYIFNDQIADAIENLSELCNVLVDYRYENYFDIDLGLVNQLDYYTGLVFKGYSLNHGKEILSGGRYDNLTKQYGYQLSATGYGMNINELLKAIYKDNKNEDFKCYSDYLILYPVECRKKGLYLADELRKKDFIVETDSYKGDSLSYIKDAKSRNVKEIIEMTEKDLKLINIRTKENYRITLGKFLNNL